MRQLVLLRACPGSGKSTWVKENNLEQYTLSPDNIRLMFQSPITTIDGGLEISQNNDGKVWKFLFELLEERMARGEFTIVDATHSRNSLIKRYKQLCDIYRYRCTVVDFTEDVSLEKCLERNKNRESYKIVPDEVIFKMYERFKTDKVGNWVTIIKPHEFKEKFYKEFIFDFNKYEKVVVFGDIHGCFEPLQKYFSENPYNENIMYIFSGDYFDRGIQNAEVFKFLDEFSNNKNVLLLTGNHEENIIKYVYDKYVRSNEFVNKTIPQLDSAGIGKKELKMFYRKLGQFAYFNYGDNTYLITHGGLPTPPTIFTPTDDMVRGVGKYEASEKVDNTWCEKTPENFISIHGHRNIYEVGICNTEKTYNLCDRPERGFHLRILEISKNGKRNPIYVKNDTYDKDLVVHTSFKQMEIPTDNEILEKLTKSKDIIKKDLGNGIFSINFSRAVFQRRRWNPDTIKARGLFVELCTAKVICRSYDKFFNWSEREETKSKNMMNTTRAPYVAYKKYNGFLGLLSYNYKTENFFIASKSTNKGDYVEYFKKILESENVLNHKLLSYLRDNNTTMIFEVIDPINDPHMIKYDKPELVLLDIVENEFEEKLLSYEKTCSIANSFNLKHKKIEYKFNSWAELYTWRQETKDNYSLEIEGWVIEDSNGFKVKMKSPYYNFWKFMRGVKEQIVNNRYINNKKFATAHELKVYNYMLKQDKDWLKNSSIIDIRDKFLNEGGFGENINKQN